MTTIQHPPGDHITFPEVSWHEQPTNWMTSNEIALADIGGCLPPTGPNPSEQRARLAAYSNCLGDCPGHDQIKPIPLWRSILRFILLYGLMSIGWLTVIVFLVTVPYPLAMGLYDVWCISHDIPNENPMHGIWPMDWDQKLPSNQSHHAGGSIKSKE